MRRKRFPLKERLILTPTEILPVLKYLPAYLALNFTGSTPFTGVSGVRLQLRG